MTNQNRDPLLCQRCGEIFEAPEGGFPCDAYDTRCPRCSSLDIVSHPDHNTDQPNRDGSPGDALPASTPPGAADREPAYCPKCGDNLDYTKAHEGVIRCRDDQCDYERDFWMWLIEIDLPKDRARRLFAEWDKEEDALYEMWVDGISPERARDTILSDYRA